MSAALLVVIASLVAATSVAATAGLHGVFGDWTFLLVAAIGAAGAAAVVVGAAVPLLIGEASPCRRSRSCSSASCSWPPTEHRTSSRASPTGGPTCCRRTPPDLTPPLRAVPLTLAWFGVALGGEIARRHRQPALPTSGRC